MQELVYEATINTSKGMTAGIFLDLSETDIVETIEEHRQQGFKLKGKTVRSEYVGKRFIKLPDGEYYVRQEIL